MAAPENNNNEPGRYRRLLEHDNKLMDAFTDRLGHLETDSASTRSDIKSLFNLVENIALQLERMADRTRPNTMGFFAAAIALSALISTIGVLAFAPVYRSIDDIKFSDHGMKSDIAAIQSTRYTPDDAREMKAVHDSDLREVDGRLSNRIYRNEQVLIDLLSRTATVEGKHEAVHTP